MNETAFLLLIVQKIIFQFQKNNPAIVTVAS